MGFGDTDRRRFLRTAGATIALGGLAGCSGQEGENTTAQQQNQQQTQAQNQQGGTTTGSAPSSNVEINYWGTVHSQGPSAREAIFNHLDRFEDETGIRVKRNFSSIQSAQSGKWSSVIDSGASSAPHVANMATEVGALLLGNDQILPVSEWPEEPPDRVTNAIDGMRKPLQAGLRGYIEPPIEASEVAMAPWGLTLLNIFIARRDYLEQAGISNEFPPENYDQLVQQGKALQADSDAQYGCQVYGTPGDVSDGMMRQWAAAELGTGFFLNEELSDTVVDNDFWKRAFGNFVDVYKEHELSSPATPTASDETAGRLIARGQVGMSSISTSSLPVVKEANQQAIDDGKIVWGPNWKLSAGRGAKTAKYLSIVRRSDASEEQMIAAQRLVESFFDDSWQTQQVFSQFGMMPAVSETWSKLQERPDNLLQASQTQAADANTATFILPERSAILYDIMGSTMQKAFTGGLSAEEAMVQSAQMIRNQVDFSKYPVYR